MVVPPNKQKSIQDLYHQGARVSDICKELRVDRKTVKKYLGLSSQSQPSQQVQRRPAIPLYDNYAEPPTYSRGYDDFDNEFRQPISVPYSHYEHDIQPYTPEPYNPPIRHHRHSEPRSEPIPVNPRVQALDEQLEDFRKLQARSGIPISRPKPYTIPKPTFEEIEVKKRRAHQEKMLNLRLGLIEIEANVRKAKEGDYYQWRNENNGNRVTKTQFKKIFHDVLVAQPKPSEKTFELMEKISSDDVENTRRMRAHQEKIAIIKAISKELWPMVGKGIEMFLSKTTNSNKPLQARVIKYRQNLVGWL